MGISVERLIRCAACAPLLFTLIGCSNDFRATVEVRPFDGGSDQSLTSIALAVEESTTRLCADSLIIEEDKVIFKISCERSSTEIAEIIGAEGFYFVSDDDQ